jgi:predicted aconitase
MKRRYIWAAGGTLAAAAVALGLGVGSAQAGPGETDVPITGDALARASAVALAHTGGGTVTATEVGDEEGFYEVEVTRADGSQLDVHLAEDFTVLGSLADHE